jgi:hypothetical protein
MVGRCTNPKTPHFHNYGGRGISVCDEWINNFSAFFAHVGHRPSSLHSIDRKDNNGNYEPGNVRWATQAEQQRNLRKNINITVGGETKCAREWSRQFGVDHKIIISRFRRGISGMNLFAPPDRRDESLRGVYFNKRMGRWQVRVSKRHVGTFDTIESAIKARDAAKCAE